jgi:glucose/arabinose dehydrogenase
VTGLEVPWGLAFLPNGDILVTERPGRIRLVAGGVLQPQSIATLQVGETGEGGLLGIALHPNFASNRYFYVYYTTTKNGSGVNRVQRYIISNDRTSATPDKVLIDDIPSGTFHDGGRIKFGPDGYLYIGTGDAVNAPLAQDPSSPNGKILRLTPDGDIPSDNPQSGKPWFVGGIRNLEAFDWADFATIILADHGPSGEYQGRTGGDKVSFARRGDNLGWPTIWHCESKAGLVSPILTWNTATPPGGGAIYKGNKIPEWTGSFIVGTLGSKHLHRVAFNSSGVTTHEVYLSGNPPNGYGRLRDVVSGPDGYLYVTTSNCDSRGSCPADKDYILRIVPGAP